MSDATVQLELEAKHRNQFLFSNHFLNNRLPEQKAWRDIADYDVRLIFEQLQRKWAEVDPNGLKEAQTEEQWIRPVLDALGHVYRVQVSIETPRTVREPDYVLTPDVESRNELKGTLTEDDLTNAIAVADAKKWDRDLDAKGTERSELSEVPSLQIDTYLRYSGLDWGILTNGRKWRLFHADSSHKLEVYYEVDLPQLLEQDRLDAFKYFYLFFRREAFGGTPSFLQQVLEESKAYEHGISEDLESQVYDALVSLSQGFFDLKSNGLTPGDDTLKKVHDNSLIVLYRLLFLLFAESRSLLPMNNRRYKEQYSLANLKRKIRKHGEGDLGIAGGTKHWSYLENLFHFVDKGQDELGIPPYNGGLFDPGKHPFLEKHKVGDRHLAKAIDLLARAVDPRTGKREFVDYRDLEVRHLGSIYEGLLEYKLRYAEEPITVDSSGEYKAADTEAGADVRAGQVYLVTDKGERKATGSYYTPDYIVEYIVEQTVGPILEELREEHTNEQGELVDRDELVEKVLNVDVLDPAMGSGHFLVEVTDFIARFLVEVSTVVDDEETGDETEIAYWRRRVAQACVYGVDLNPLAVELAKLSLWLKTVAKDKPLSFLDHHLRPGNSLVGANVDDLPLEQERTDYQKRKERRARKAGQETLMDTVTFQEAMSSARGLMDQIEAIAGDDLEEVQEAAHLYEKLVEEHTKAPKLVADVVLAQEFGLDIDTKFFKEMVPRLRDGSWESVPEYRKVVNEAKQITEDLRFFHWELEFPEVFFGEEGELAGNDAGFDAVVGNPPYIDSEEMVRSAPQIRKFIKDQYSTTTGNWDVFVAFIERSIELAQAKRYTSLIVPNKLVGSEYATEIQKLFLHHSLRSLRDYSRIPVFDDADVYPVIYNLQKGGDRNNFQAVKMLPDNNDHPIEGWSEKVPISALDKLPGGYWWPLFSSNRRIVHNYLKGTSKLDDLFDIHDAATVAEAYEIREILKDNPDPSSSSSFKLINTGTIDKYEPLWGRKPIQYIKKRLDHPVVTISELASVSRTRLHQASQPKIIIAGMVKELECFYDRKGRYLAGKSTCIILGDPDLLGPITTLMNSRLYSFIYREIFGSLAMQGGYLTVSPPQLRRMAIPSEDKLEQNAREIVSSFARKEVYEVCELQEDSSIRRVLCELGKVAARSRRRRETLKSAFNPFKYLNRGVAVEKLRDVFRDEIKFAEQVYELGRVHHDIDDLALKRRSNDWELQVEFKKRDEESGWENWVKDGRNIVREWVTVYRFNDMSDAKAIYYQKAFEVLDEFEHTGNFPGGKTRTTKKKLDLTKVPVFDEDVELDALVELTEELADVEQKIQDTDELIDQLVYELYDLTDEEIAVVEKRT